MHPEKEIPDFNLKHPVVKVTDFSDVLINLGKMMEIYGSGVIKIQCRDIEDVTGTSMATGGEIPQSITTMVHSTLNAIGHRVLYIPYWPDYINGLQVSGLPVSPQRLVPDIILTGGITEFDRALETIEKVRNFDAETESISGAPTWFAGDTIGLDYAKGGKLSRASIALDFNFISYAALCGIPKVQSINAISVYKAVSEEEFGFTLFGPTIGMKGSMKKVQGRHEALRLLVQFSVIELLGKYMDIPFWNLLPNAQPDAVILESIKTHYLQKDHFNQTLLLQEMLILHGFDVTVSGMMDGKTKVALHEFDSKYNGVDDVVDVSLYLKLYVSVPVLDQTIEKRRVFEKGLQELKEKLTQQEMQQQELEGLNWDESENYEILNTYEPLPDELTIERIFRRLGQKEKIRDLIKGEMISDKPEPTEIKNEKPLGW